MAGINVDLTPKSVDANVSPGNKDDTKYNYITFVDTVTGLNVRVSVKNGVLVVEGS